MIPIESKIIKPRKTPVIIIYAVLILLIYLLKGDSEANKILNFLIAGVTLVFGLLYLSLVYSFIAIDNDGIALKTPFKKEKLFYWNEISTITWEWIVEGHTANLHWKIFNTSNSIISFEPSYYKRKDLHFIAVAIMEKCPTATIHNKIKKVAENRFPWYWL